MNGVALELRRARSALAAAGISNAATEAGWLMASVLGVASGALATRLLLSEDDKNRFQALVGRRCAREPLQYLLGRAAFRYLDLQVGPGVFVPRPETELLVDVVLQQISTVDGPEVVDLCSGSGAIGLAVATEAPDARVTLLERSSAALNWLRLNVEEQSAGVRERVRVVQADVTSLAARAALSALAGRVDVVAVNPPYVPARAVVGAEVAHDPADAVFGGADGLDLFPALSSLAAFLLRPGGVLTSEHDESHAGALTALVRKDGWDDVTDVEDLAGRPRFVTARRRGAAQWRR